MVSFGGQYLECLIIFHLFIFVLISTALGDWPKKTLVGFMSENGLSVLSSRSFIVSSLMFKPFGVSSCALREDVVWLHGFTCSCPTFPVPFAEEVALSHFCIFASFVKEGWVKQGHNDQICVFKKSLIDQGVLVYFGLLCSIDAYGSESIERSFDLSTGHYASPYPSYPPKT